MKHEGVTEKNEAEEEGKNQRKGEKTREKERGSREQRQTIEDIESEL